jgi:hypothetical protein
MVSTRHVRRTEARWRQRAYAVLAGRSAPRHVRAAVQKVLAVLDQAAEARPARMDHTHHVSEGAVRGQAGADEGCACVPSGTDLRAVGRVLLRIQRSLQRRLRHGCGSTPGTRGGQPAPGSTPGTRGGQPAPACHANGQRCRAEKKNASESIARLARRTFPPAQVADRRLGVRDAEPLVRAVLQDPCAAKTSDVKAAAADVELLRPQYERTVRSYCAQQRRQRATHR